MEACKCIVRKCRVKIQLDIKDNTLYQDKLKNWESIIENEEIWEQRMEKWLLPFSTVQSLSHVRLFATPEPQHARPPCPSPTPKVHPDPCPSSQWCHPTISSSVVPFSSCPQSFRASGSFQMSQFFASGGQSTQVSASASVLPMNTQDWSPLGWTGWISLQSKGLSRVFSNTTMQKHQFFGTQLSSQSNTHIHTWPLEKPIALTRWTFVDKVMSQLFNMLSRLVITLFQGVSVF